MQNIGNLIRKKAAYIKYLLKDDSGLSVVEMILILVVIIALVLIFKTQLISLVHSIFDKITSESSGI
jgi:Flp pilus assembly pilin Flp